MVTKRTLPHEVNKNICIIEVKWCLTVQNHMIRKMVSYCTESHNQKNGALLYRIT